MDANKFAVSEDDLWDVPDVGTVLMLLPPVTDIAFRILPCESPCEHLSCYFDKVAIDA